ncbi:MAG: carboxypeptidase regulatory-like domain-containing protein [Armatimonadetes bacterium]|nr:carboxypeptidase regulatory-like domain-containing protein [Armatimonadota bacterium]
MMWIKQFKKITLGLAVGAVAAALVGCGGGGSSASSSGGGGGGDSAALQGDIVGLVTLPGSTAGAAASRQAESEVPVTGATVELKSVEDDSVVATTTTDSEGNYAFENVPADTDFSLEVNVEKEGKTYGLRAIVSTGDTTGTPNQRRDINALTTVSAETALDQFKAAKEADANYRPTKLEDVCKSIEDKEKDNFSAPDLSNKDDVKKKKDETLASVSPEGQYLGTFGGDKSGVIAAFVREGNFFIIGVNDQQTSQLQVLSDGESGTSGDSNSGDGDANTGDSNSGNDNSGDGNSGDSNSGNENSGGGGSTDNTKADVGSPIAVGPINKAGVVFAKTRDGKLQLTGIIANDVGTGVWINDKGQTGWWKVQRSTFEYAGLYVQPHEGVANPQDYLAIVATNTGDLFMVGYSLNWGWVFGSGSVSDAGDFTLNWKTDSDTSGQATGKVTEKVMTFTVDYGSVQVEYHANKAFKPRNFIREGEDN